MKDHYRGIVNLLRTKAPDFASFEEMVLLLKNTNIEDVEIINQVVAELACDTKQQIIDVCDSVKELLLRKNEAYGNSFQCPINIFCKASAVEQIHVRIDDKLNRIAKGQNTDLVQEDTIMDLIGYLILLKVLNG